MPRPHPFSLPDVSEAISESRPAGRAAPGGGEPSAFCGDDATYTFTFSADLTTVEGMNRVVGSSTRAVNITGSTFETIVGTNDLGVQAVVSVEQTRADTRASDARIYSDTDGDGNYAETFDIHVAAAAAMRLPQHQFTFASDATVLTDQVLHRGQWRSETIDSNEVLQRLTLGGETYVVRTEQESSGEYHFEIFRDDNGDGTWTGIARGESSGTYIDTATGALSLVGVQDYLSVADGIVG